MKLFLWLKKEPGYKKEIYAAVLFLVIAVLVLFAPPIKIDESGQDNACYQAGP